MLKSINQNLVDYYMLLVALFLITHKSTLLHLNLSIQKCRLPIISQLKKKNSRNSYVRYTPNGSFTISLSKYHFKNKRKKLWLDSSSHHKTIQNAISLFFFFNSNSNHHDTITFLIIFKTSTLGISPFFFYPSLSFSLSLSAFHFSPKLQIQPIHWE